MEYRTLDIGNSGSRNEIRMRVIFEFFKEYPGEGKGELASKYIYFVETIEEGNRIYLKRPAYLHNGFDFLICVENLNFCTNGKERNYPKQTEIIDDLRNKKRNNPQLYLELLHNIENVYNCSEMLINNTIGFNDGFSCELIVKVLKWLFIEQDIRYWNYSGRDMLWGEIKKI